MMPKLSLSAWAADGTYILEYALGTAACHTYIEQLVPSEVQCAIDLPCQASRCMHNPINRMHVIVNTAVASKHGNNGLCCCQILQLRARIMTMSKIQQSCVFPCSHDLLLAALAVLAIAGHNVLDNSSTPFMLIISACTACL